MSQLLHIYIYTHTISVKNVALGPGTVGGKNIICAESHCVVVIYLTGTLVQNNLCLYSMTKLSTTNIYNSFITVSQQQT